MERLRKNPALCRGLLICGFNQKNAYSPKKQRLCKETTKCPHPLRSFALLFFSKEMIDVISRCFKTGRNQRRYTVFDIKKNATIFLSIIAFRCGGQGGIRTLDTLLTYTRVPVVRLRPAQPPVHKHIYEVICSAWSGASDGT